MIVFGVWLALAGAVALLRRAGRAAPGPAAAPPRADGVGRDRPGAGRGKAAAPHAGAVPAGGRAGAGADRARGRHPHGTPAAGQKVLVWYDAEDPGDILVYGRWGRAADWAFVAAGAVAVLGGLILAGRP